MKFLKQYPILAGFLALLVVFGLLVGRKYLTTDPPHQGPVPVPIQQEPRQLRDVTLYFGATDGTYLAPEGREIEDCLVEDDCIRETVQALVNGPVGNLIPLFPSHSVVRDVSIENGTAVVDFSRETVTGHPGGSMSEILTVYGLANTLAVNFPHLRQVKIIIEGHPVETFKGHIGLIEPVKADFRFSRPPSGEPVESDIEKSLHVESEPEKKS